MKQEFIQWTQNGPFVLILRHNGTVRDRELGGFMSTAFFLLIIKVNIIDACDVGAHVFTLNLGAVVQYQVFGSWYIFPEYYISLIFKKNRNLPFTFVMKQEYIQWTQNGPFLLILRHNGTMRDRELDRFISTAFFRLIIKVNIVDACDVPAPCFHLISSCCHSV